MSRSACLEGNKAQYPVELQSPARSRIRVSHFADPPSSPPPSSPLPPTPSYASLSPYSSVISSLSSIHPPRQQVSLPELRTRSHCLSDNYEGAPRNVGGALGSVPNLLFPYNSPTKSYCQQLDATVVTRKSEPFADGYSAVSARSRSPFNGGNQRIWWSDSTDSTSTADDLSTGWPLDSRRPPIPPKSKKRKREMLAQRRVARSALHVPSQLTTEECEEPGTTELLQHDQAGLPLLHNELLTSLPLWPTRVSSGSSKECHYQKSALDGTIPVRRSSSSDNPCQERSGKKHRPDTLQDRISFCAVTNLESLCAIKEASSATQQYDLTCSVRSQSLGPAWHQRHRRHLWIVATIAFVLLAVSGILAGIIWRLSGATK